MKKLFYAVIALTVSFSIISCNSDKTMENDPINEQDMDLTANPVEDFYQYANGGWINTHPIPDDKSSYNSFTVLRDENEKKLKTIIDELLTSNAEEGTINKKISDFFKTGMDTTTINELGFKPLQKYSDRIDEIKNTEDLVNLLGEFKTQGMSFLFHFYVSPDNKNSAMNIGQFSQGGLGLPDVSYYTDKGDKADEIRAKYKQHIQKMFELSGVESTIAKEKSEIIYNIEKQLADASLTRVERRDEERTYNIMSFADFNSTMPNFDLKLYITKLGIEDPGNINVGMPDFFKALDEILANTDIENLKWYLKWHLIRMNADYLSDDFVNESFAFYGKELSGAITIRDRWKRVLETVNETLDEAMGKIYVEKYFPEEYKERLVEMIEKIKVAFAERIKVLPWMSEETKEKALDKLASTTVKIGYPDKWKDFSDLEITENSYFENVMRARTWAYNDMIKKLNQPVDRSEWGMAPHIVNAYSNPQNNEIVFPAGILQPPFFYPEGDDALNYGAIGMVISHELTHGFDDQGRKYDKEGNMTDWWTEEDNKLFNERTQMLVDQFNNILIIDTVYANGALSLGENIADLGGLSISMSAFKNTDEYKTNKKIGGFTPTQRFFLAYAKIWAQNIRDEEKIRLTKVDVHSLGKNRVNEPLRNMPEFYEAFGAKEGNYMFLTEDKRVFIW